MGPMWKKLMKKVDLDEPTSFLDHVYLGCTQRECKPNEIIIEQFTKMFESRISAGGTEKLPGWEKPHEQRWRGPMILKDMLEHALNDMQFYKVSSPCLDDHQFKQEELHSVGQLSPRIGRPDILWSVNKLARAVTKWTQACDRRLARLISWATLLSIADWLYFATQILLATLRTKNPLLGESYVSSEAEHLSPSVGCARSRHQYPTVLQSLRSFRWMLDCAWMDFLLLIFGTLWLTCYFQQTTLQDMINWPKETWCRIENPKHQLKWESENLSNY